MKERRYFKLRRARWRAGVLLELQGWRRNLTVASEVFKLSAHGRGGGVGVLLLVAGSMIRRCLLIVNMSERVKSTGFPYARV